MRDRTGISGEEEAARYLKRKGYRILSRNYRCRLGEIDLVALKRGTLVFCEVKARNDKAFGEPFEAVSQYKQERLRRLAESYLLENRQKRELNYRFDVISILFANGGRVEELTHIENAF
jgi:putative endonuclease